MFFGNKRKPVKVLNEERCWNNHIFGDFERLVKEAGETEIL